ncbi:MAG: ABC transporter substrate binding protein [Bryobacteraceae bacterium]
MPRPFLTPSFIILSLLALISTSPRSLPARTAAQAAPEKNVLILESFTVGDRAGAVEHLESSLRSRVKAPVNFHLEYLESLRFRNPAYEDGAVDTLRRDYGGHKLDLVVTDVYPAFQFAIKHRSDLFPEVPIVFMGVSAVRIQGENLGTGVTGISTNSYIHGTLNLALRLHPGTRNVAVVSGDSDFERYWVGKTDEEIRLNADELQEIDLVGLPASQLHERILTLPPHTIVLFEMLPSASSDPAAETYDLLEEISHHAPTYSPANDWLGHGVVGGSYVDSADVGVKAGEMGARIIAGKKAERIPVVTETSEVPYVDWRQLQRWHISEAALPSGTVVQFRQPSVWDLYWKYILAAAAVMFLQALLIVGLLWQRTRKRKAEAALRENEERLRVMADAAPSLIWTSDKDGNVTYQNEERLDFSTLSAGMALGEKWKRYIHPDDLAGVLEANARAYESRSGFSKEYRLRRSDGVYRWMFDVAVPRISPDGTFLGFIGSAIDVTDQKLAQEALERLSGKLIEAQEKERSRIARELHDDICQRLAVLSLEMERANSGSSVSNSRRDARMMEMRQHCAEIASDVQALSHELHSSKLDYLGLVAATRGFCAEFSKLKNVNVTFTDENVPHPLPKDVSLCLFRVTQEALHNALKHSGAKQFTVSLRGTADQVRLEVKDQGVGFDAEAATRQAGLGLVSMQERIHLVKGTFRIESKARVGTSVVARVPLGGDVGAAQPASGSEVAP